MSTDPIRQAADALLLFLSTGLDSPDRADELSTLVGHIYSDRLQPLRHDDPQVAIDEVCQRFSTILAEHLALEAALLALVARRTQRAPASILDDVVAMLRQGRDGDA